MPVFRSGDEPPAWCELRSFEIVSLEPGARRRFERRAAQEKLIVGNGSCRISVAEDEIRLVEGQVFDLEPDRDAFEAGATDEPTTVIHLSGTWGEELGGIGLFTLAESDSPSDVGDPVDYPKRTSFDCHYHDCDEYWILLAGQATAISEGNRYTVGAGDCVATGMGHHHDLPYVPEPIRGVFFETTLEGEKRRGHLWDHTHGMAQPKLDRV